MAKNFSGSGEYYYRSVALTTRDDWTLAAWINIDSLSQTGMVVYNGEDGGGGPYNGYGFLVSGDSGTSGGNLVGLYGGIAWKNSGYTFSSTGVWYHVVMTRNSGTLRFYVNGSDVGYSNTDADNGTPSGSFTVGSQDRNSEGFGNNFDGKIAEVGAWNRALSTGEISSLAKGVAPSFFRRELKAYIPLTGEDSVTSTNLLSNSTFEGDTAGNGNIPAGWTSFGGSGLDYKGVSTAWSYDGSNSFEMDHSSSVDTGIKIQVAGLTASTAYTLSAYMKTSAAVDNASLTLDTYQDGIGGSTSNTTNVSGATETRQSVTLTVDSTSVNIFVGLGAFGSGSDGEAFFDALQLEQGSSATTYTSGSTGGAEIDWASSSTMTVNGTPDKYPHPPIIYPSTNLVLPTTLALPSVTPSVSDSASVSDTLPSYSQTEPVSVSDSATIEIVYPDLLPTVSDSVSVSDTPSLDPIEIVTSVSDSVSVSDSASISIQSVADTTVTASDTASVADTPVLTVSDPQAIASDTVSVTDSPTVSIQAVPDLNVSASDTASIADTLPSYEYTEPVSVIDSPTIQPQGEIVTRSVSASDTINVSEVFQAAIEVNASISDSVTVSDEPIISVVALDTPSASVSDLVGVTDTPTVSVQPTTTPEVTVSDSVSVSDSASVDIALDVTAQENVSVTDTATAKVSDLIMNISDSVSVSESVTLNVSGTPEVSVSDSVSVSENTSINIYTPGEKLSFIVLDLGQVIMEI